MGEPAAARTPEAELDRVVREAGSAAMPAAALGAGVRIVDYRHVRQLEIGPGVAETPFVRPSADKKGGRGRWTRDGLEKRATRYISCKMRRADGIMLPAVVVGPSGGYYVPLSIYTRHPSTQLPLNLSFPSRQLFQLVFSLLEGWRITRYLAAGFGVESHKQPIMHYMCGIASIKHPDSYLKRSQNQTSLLQTIVRLSRSVHGFPSRLSPLHRGYAKQTTNRQMFIPFSPVQLQYFLHFGLLEHLPRFQAR